MTAFSVGNKSSELVASVPSVDLLAADSFKSSATCAAVDIPLSASLVFSTSVKPTIVLSIPDTVPVKVGDANGASLVRSARGPAT